MEKRGVWHFGGKNLCVQRFVYRAISASAELFVVYLALVLVVYFPMFIVNRPFKPTLFGIETLQ